MRTLLLSALLLTAPVAAAPFSFSAARIGDDVKTLASDAFAGRGPGEVGEAQTLAFLAARFQAAGLEPAGPQGGWLQPVPMIRLDRAAGAALSVQMNGTALPIRFGRQRHAGAAPARRHGDQRRADGLCRVWRGGERP